MGKSYDFSGWATKNNLRCTDGRIIRQDAFKHNDGATVPLVWNHQHNDPHNVLGHALLENRKDGVYAYCTLNDTEQGRNVKELIKHGDVVSLSIYANKLRQNGGDVLHGDIKELSVVLAGANPGAFIDSIIMHGEISDEEAVMYTGEPLSLFHNDLDKSEEDEVEDVEKKEDDEEEVVEHSEKENEEMAKEKTIQDVIDEMTEEQRTVLYALVGMTAEGNDDAEDDEMKQNVFDMDERNPENVLSHSDMTAIFADAKRTGSLKDAVLAHGIEDIEILFPDAHNLNTPPEFIKREMDWVTKVMNGTHHTPFSRIKSMFANITEDEARAKGYIKGKMKKEEVFSLLKRTTTPTTIYKKQKLDRDDVIDIVDFDVVAWLKQEMRMMLNEEIARAVLVGDGRLNSDDDKINELNIRPIWKDEDLYTVKYKMTVAGDADEFERAKTFIHSVIRSRKQYKGSGNPTMFMDENLLTDCLLLEDNNGRVIYESQEKLATALRVKEIVTVPVMENLSRTGDHDETLTLGGIMVNLKDYNIGADKGGAVSMFDDFDIDYNAQKYLIETRCSGALIKPYSAVVFEFAGPGKPM